MLPPGIIYLIKHLPKLLAPPAVTYLAAREFGHRLGYNVPWWSLGIALVFSTPLWVTLEVQWQIFADRREAARRGAVLPPEVESPYPGGLQFLAASHKDAYPSDVLGQLFVKYGWTINHRILFENRYITTDPANIKAILATRFDEFEKGPELNRVFGVLLGTGVFAADGDLWKFHRNMARPYFSRDRISDFDNFDKHSQLAIQKMKARFAQGFAVDFQDVVARFTLDSATEFLFGNDVRSLSEELPYPYFHDATKEVQDSKQAPLPSSSTHSATEFVQAFGEAQTIIAYRSRFGDHWPLSEFWVDKLAKPKRIIDEYIEGIVREAIIQRREKKGVVSDDDKDEESFLEHLFNSTEDPAVLRDAIMNLLVAGRDTTAATLTFAVYLLADHPQVFERLREEVMSHIGPDRRPTFDDFKEMKYMRAVINETLRLYPAVPFNLRVSKGPTVFPAKGDATPIYVPGRIKIAYGVLAMHRRKDLWGPDAHDFDPDRFIDERLQKYLVPNPFMFLPFNAGPRICLGQQFAYNEMSFFIVRLLQSFSSVKLCSKSQPPESKPPAEWAADTLNTRKSREKVRVKSHFTLYIQDGLWVEMGEA
ncbi:cytochrome P450 monooxygenase pc-3 [Coprinopsis marcescibilis]|uniref:Cytochrome P450 monooxygenase pc-3 n=1 Tax=Coprinopsis marcescibilis TaxID=230819 RepID=A0A5C3KQJ6_COPMA|nr:cytochrome P450 monooxygenase pc-3 [Coprinopsis marcescibilis]